MFPDAENSYSVLSQHPHCPSVSLPISFNLRFPEQASGAWNVSASFAAVPEAAVNENRNALPWKKEVGPARDLRVVQLPAAYSSLDQSRP
jgi:hypothetical protein